MTSKYPEEFTVAPVQIFDCEMIPVPPGTKSAGRLPRGLEQEMPPNRVRIIAVSLLALVGGVVIGRFLLP